MDLLPQNKQALYSTWVIILYLPSKFVPTRSLRGCPLSNLLTAPCVTETQLIVVLNEISSDCQSVQKKASWVVRRTSMAGGGHIVHCHHVTVLATRVDFVVSRQLKAPSLGAWLENIPTLNTGPPTCSLRFAWMSPPYVHTQLKTDENQTKPKTRQHHLNLKGIKWHHGNYWQRMFADPSPSVTTIWDLQIRFNADKGQPTPRPSCMHRGVREYYDEKQAGSDMFAHCSVETNSTKGCSLPWLPLTPHAITVGQTWSSQRLRESIDRKFYPRRVLKFPFFRVCIDEKQRMMTEMLEQGRSRGWTLSRVAWTSFPIYSTSNPSDEEKLQWKITLKQFVYV